MHWIRAAIITGRLMLFLGVACAAVGVFIMSNGGGWVATVLTGVGVFMAIRGLRRLRGTDGLPEQMAGQAMAEAQVLGDAFQAMSPAEKQAFEAELSLLARTYGPGHQKLQDFLESKMRTPPRN